MHNKLTALVKLNSINVAAAAATEETNETMMLALPHVAALLMSPWQKKNGGPCIDGTHSCLKSEGWQG